MNITLIGAGNLAVNLAIALHKKGYNIEDVYSYNLENARLLANKVNANATNNLTNLNHNSDVYIISVKDFVLQDVVNSVCKLNPNAVYIHTAGSISIDIFKNKATNYGVFYPLQTFSKAKEVSFDNIPCFIEGSNNTTNKTIENIARSISSCVNFASSNDRKQLHLAAVFACNFVNHLYVLAEETLNNTAFNINVLLPLIEETTEKLKHLSPKNAQTGPAIREDYNVMNAHLTQLANNETLKNIYAILSDSIIKNKKT